MKLRRDTIKHTLYVASAVAFAILLKQFVDVVWPHFEFHESSISVAVPYASQQSVSAPQVSHRHRVTYNHTRTTALPMASPWVNTGISAAPNFMSSAPQSVATMGGGSCASTTYSFHTNRRKATTPHVSNVAPVASGQLYAVSLTRPFAKTMPSEASAATAEERPVGEVHRLGHDMGDFTGNTEGENSGDVGNPVPLGDGWVLALFAACFAMVQFITRKKSKKI